MKILVVCDQGNNRSVTIASRLKYWGHDILTAGIKVNPPETMALLLGWADRVIVTDKQQWAEVVAADEQWETGLLPKFQLWDVGPDTYPRPFNKELLAKVNRLMEEHEAEYK